MKTVDLVAKHLEIDAHLKEQYTALESILVEMNIQANFDPEIKEDLEWAAEQIKIVLDAVPEIKIMEEKVGLLKEATGDIDKATRELGKILDVTAMIPKEEDKKEEKKEEKKSEKKDEKKDEKKSEKKDEKKSEKKDEKKEEKKEEKKDAKAA